MSRKQEPSGIRIGQDLKATEFARLHNIPGKILILPNAWDVPSARLFENAGFPAVATSSAGMFASLGYPDGEAIGRKKFLESVKRIGDVLSLPLSVDSVAGFGKNTKDLKVTVKGLIEAGAVGMNIEDFEHETKQLYPLEFQVKKIATIMEVTESLGVKMFVNARTDSLRYFEGDDDEKFEEEMRRCKEFRDAGAGCVYPMGLVRREDIERFVREMNGFPINVMLRTGVPPLNDLESIGIKRVSFGPGASYAAMGLLKKISNEILNERNTDSLLNGGISYEELISLTEPRPE